MKFFKLFNISLSKNSSLCIFSNWYLNQGCDKPSLAEILLIGSLTKHFFIKSIASLEILSNFSFGKTIGWLIILSKISELDCPLKTGLPHNII